MMRNLVVLLACAGLLAFGLSISSFAKGIDADLDGVTDISDNCTIDPNGPSGSGTTSCNAQEDGDGDGYGNPCDTDFNNDGATGPDDLSTMLAAVKVVGTDPNLDPNCDGASGPDDLSKTLADVKAVRIPGPSCCAP